jgi:hypothetical protein
LQGAINLLSAFFAVCQEISRGFIKRNKRDRAISPSATGKFHDQIHPVKQHPSLAVQTGFLLIDDNLPARANNILLAITNLLSVINNLLLIAANLLSITNNLLLRANNLLSVTNNLLFKANNLVFVTNNLLLITNNPLFAINNLVFALLNSLAEIQESLITACYPAEGSC